MDFGVEAMQGFEELVSLFIESAKEHVEAIEQLLLKVEQEAFSKETFFELYRHAHSLKGSAYMAGFKHIGDLAHAMEDVLKALHDGRIEPKTELFDTLLKANDRIAQMLQEGEQDASDIIAELKLFLQPSEPQRPLSKETTKPGKAVSAPKLRETTLEYIRIPFAKVERIRNLIEELSVTKEDVHQAFVQIAELMEADRKQEAKTLATNVIKNFRYIDNLWQRLEGELESISMIPLSTLFSILPRYVRELANSLGKDVELTVEGGEIEADKRAIEAIKDPLIHLIRNAIDHGIEKPEERVRLGKPKTGRVSVKAYIQMGNLVLEIADDGQGIDWSKIRETAIKRGLIERGQEVSREELEAFIFQPGFSTSTFVTSVSGRGVGLDVVKTNVESLGGTVECTSERGKGTTFKIQIPLRIGKQKVLILKAGEFLFGIPLQKVERIVKVEPESLQFSAGKYFLNIDDTLVPAFSLYQAFVGEEGGFNRIAIIFRHNGRSVAALIDSVIDEREISRKPPSKILGSWSGVTGFTFVQGNILPLLDLSYWAETGMEQKRKPILKEERQELSALVVEDNMAVRRTLAHVLSANGFSVMEAHDGLEAWQILSAGKKFDVVVTDIEMPRMDGLTLAKKIRSKFKDMPIVIVTSTATENKVREVDADGFMLKSEFDERNFVELVRYAIERRAHRKE